MSEIQPLNDSDEECTGTGNCHGCLKWCSNCGDVSHECDMRLRGERCAEHPVPPPANIIRTARAGAEKMIRDGRELEREGQKALQEAVDAERARCAYDKQVAAEERRVFDLPLSAGKA